MTSDPHGSGAAAPDGPRAAVARAVAEGLAASPKRLPPWLFYDAEGSAIYERITELDEYYPTRTERLIFEQHGAAIVAAALGERTGRPTFVELGAGTAAKTELLLRHAPAARFVPVDVSPTPLELARARLARDLPDLEVCPLAATHEQAFAALAARGLPPPAIGLFIGSSIGNYEDADAAALLAGLRGVLGAGARLVLGTDLRKDPAVLVAAYDDALGVTAAFNRNVLARINRELGGHFDPGRFRHVALWDAERSRIEMHLESTAAQEVRIDALGAAYAFAAGERIHTESSVKYDLPHVDRLLAAAGFARERSFHDPRRLYAVHVAGAR